MNSFSGETHRASFSRETHRASLSGETQINPEVRTAKVLQALKASDPWKLFESGAITRTELQVGSLKNTFQDLIGSERLRQIQDQLGYSRDVETAATQTLISMNFMHQLLSLSKLRDDQLWILFPEYSHLVWDQLMMELQFYQFQAIAIPFTDIEPNSPDQELYQFAVSGAIDLRPFSFQGRDLYEFLYRWTLLNIPKDRTFSLPKQVVTPDFFRKNNMNPQSHTNRVRMAFSGRVLVDADQELLNIVKNPPLVTAKVYLQIQTWLNEKDSMVMMILKYREIPLTQDLLFRITRGMV